MTIPEALESWNTSAEKCGWPQVRTNREQPRDRMNKLREILKNGMEDWHEALQKAEQSDFLCGRTNRSPSHAGWRFNIDTMVRPAFFTRLLEGVYTNATAAGPSYESPETLLWKARLARWKPGDMWLGIWGAPPSDPACQAPKAVLDQWRARQEMH